MFLMPMEIPPSPAPQAQVRILSGADIWAGSRESALLKGQALAIQGDKVIELAPVKVLTRKHPKAELVNLKGGTLLPGLFESHGHVSSLGASLEELQLNGLKDKNEVLKKIKEWSKNNTQQWIIGRGWDQNLWFENSFPTAQDLDELNIPNPVLLKRVDGHALWVNSKALSLASINQLTDDPPGGQIIRDKTGNPSGILVDKATKLIENIVPPPDLPTIKRRILVGLDYLAGFGFTSVCDMGVNREEIAAYRSLDISNRLPIKVFAYLVDDTALIDEELNRPITPLATRFKIQGVKIYLDGALGSRGARLFEPYADDPLNKGLWITPLEDAQRTIHRVLSAGYQPAIHAIGDAANHEAINILSQYPFIQKNMLRPRIEHAQILALEDIKQMEILNITASIQPVHCTSDYSWTPSRLGKSRLNEAFPWRNLLDHNITLVLGSDTPVENPNPFITIAAAETRQDDNGEPPFGFLPTQVLTRKEAISSYTRQAAITLGEPLMGVIRAGSIADLIWVPDKLMQVKPAKLRTLKTSRIWISGQER